MFHGDDNRLEPVRAASQTGLADRILHISLITTVEAWSALGPPKFR